MAEETHYTPQTHGAKISTANPNLDGTGTLGTLGTGADKTGTKIQSASIKAIGSTSRGMIRFFITGGGTTTLLKEIDVFPITPSAVTPAFETKANLNFNLKPGFTLKVSTQNAEAFNVISEGMTWSYYNGAVREDTTQYTANNGAAKISTANSNLDGTGTVGLVYTAGLNGSRIETINIKGTVTTTPGMVRLYFVSGVNNVLFSEIPVPSATPDSTDQAFEHTIVFGDNFNLQTGIGISASTQQAQNFNIVVEGKDWNYPA